jgi:hypothetical protein
MARSFRLKVVIATYLILFSTFVSAQPGDPAVDPDPVPIQGIIYLIVGGLALGIKRIMRQKNKQ